VSKPKTYTLEIPADELEEWRTAGPRRCDLLRRLDTLATQAKADREADDLRLPWRAQCAPGICWMVKDSCGRAFDLENSERAAKLMSAAPELLEAVRAANRWRQGMPAGGTWERNVQPLIDRAIRKVETGIPG